MKKYAFINSGSSNQGKTSSIRRVFELLREKYPDVDIINESEGEALAIFTIRGIRIGIETQGDPGSRMFGSLDMFERLDCQIIVCACRTRGYTFERAFALEYSGYTCCLLTNGKSNIREMQERLNEDFARYVTNLIESIIDGNEPNIE